jgi:DNA-binding transcriptional ArsR family regulator
MKYCQSEACYLFFSTLAVPTRLGIIDVLRKSPSNVMQLAKHLNQEQSMISHNLEPLTKCRLVFVKRKGKERIYSLNKETLEPMYDIIGNHMKKYCPNGRCLERLQRSKKSDVEK